MVSVQLVIWVEMSQLLWMLVFVYPLMLVPYILVLILILLLLSFLSGPTFEANPCVGVDCGIHGSCMAIGETSFYCECEAGYTGARCESSMPFIRIPLAFLTRT